MSRDDESRIIQIENLCEDSYEFPGVFNIWLLIYRYMKISSWANIFYNILERKTQLTVIFSVRKLFQQATKRQPASSDNSHIIDREVNNKIR